MLNTKTIYDIPCTETVKSIEEIILTAKEKAISAGFVGADFEIVLNEDYAINSLFFNCSKIDHSIFVKDEFFTERNHSRNINGAEELIAGNIEIVIAKVHVLHKSYAMISGVYTANSPDIHVYMELINDFISDVSSPVYKAIKSNVFEYKKETTNHFSEKTNTANNSSELDENSTNEEHITLEETRELSNEKSANIFSLFGEAFDRFCIDLKMKSELSTITKKLG